MKSFNPTRPPPKTMEQLKLHVNEQMKAPTFQEYLRLRKQPGIGDVKAMKVCLNIFEIFALLPIDLYQQSDPLHHGCSVRS